jgi:hypothetical protein
MCSEYTALSGGYTVKALVTATNSAGSATSTTTATAAIALPSGGILADFNSDCYVNSTDLTMFIAAWKHQQTPPVPGDVIQDISGINSTPDGVVNGYDLTVFINRFGFKG